MWDLARSGIKFVSPALAGGFFTTNPQGSPIVDLTGLYIWPVISSHLIINFT